MKIYQNGYDLTADFDSIPAQNSGNIEIEFERDMEAFDDLYIITPTVGFYNGEKQGAKPLALTNNKFILPPEVFVENGYISIAISMFKDNQLINTNQITFRVNKAVGSYNILPEDEEIWQDAVINVTQQYIDKYVTKPVDDLLKEAKSQQDVAKAQQTKATQLQTAAQNSLAELNALENTVNSNENARVRAETQRNSSESTRNTNENTRITNENARKSKETERQTEENKRKTNETARQTKESERQTEENKRKTNEEGRKTEETKRDTAEKKRASDTQVALSNMSTLQKTVTDKLTNGDFIPSFKATAKAGVVPDVQVKGTKENVILDMTIPEFGGIEEYDKTVEERIANSGGEYYVQHEGQDYSGTAFDAGADLVRIDGKCEQVTLTGKNLIDFSTLEGKEVSGWAQIVAGSDVLTNVLKPNTTYTFSYNWKITKKSTVSTVFELHLGFILHSNSTSSAYRSAQVSNKNTLNDSGSFVINFTTPTTLPSDYLLLYYTNMYEASGEVGYDTVLFSNIQLEEGTVKTDYEPYCGGVASPNPNYPQEIKHVGDIRQNLFDASRLPTKTMAGITVVNNEDGSFTVTDNSSGGKGEFRNEYTLTVDETKKILKPGKLYKRTLGNMHPGFACNLIDENGSAIEGKSITTVQDYAFFEVTQEDLDNDCRLKILIHSAGDIIPGTSKCMVYQVGDGMEYVPYTPIPKYYLDINSRSANLLNAEEMVKTAKENGLVTEYQIVKFKNHNTLMTNVSTDKSRSIVFQKNKFKLNTRYYIHIEIYSYNASYTTNQRGVNLYIDYTDGTYQSAAAENSDRFNYIEFISNENKTIKNIRFSYSYHSRGYIDLDKSYISEYNEYSKAGENKTSIILDKPLCSLPNGVCDTIENGIITRNVRKVIYDGSDDEIWQDNISNSSVCWIYVLNAKKSSEVYCNQAVTSKNYSPPYSGVTVNVNGVLCVHRNALNFTTLNEFKTAIQSNPLIVYYELASPVYEKVKSPTLSTYFPTTTITQEQEIKANINFGILSKTAILQRELDKDNELYSEKFFERFFAMQRTGKIYTVKFPKFETSTLPAGTKLDDNAGLAANPSTDTVHGESDYDDIPLFKTYDVNAHVDNNGKIYIDAIKGDKNYKDTGKVDVFVLGMSYYEKYWEKDGYWYYSRSDTPHEGYTIAAECKSADGKERPFALYGKYVVGAIDGIPYSSKGLTPATHISTNSKVYISHNHAEPLFHRKGQYYCAGALSTYKYILTTFYLKYATLNSQSIMYGCFNYNLQYQVALAESNVKRVVLTTAQANNFIVGSAVSIGDPNGSTNYDRGAWHMHNIANNVLITKIEAINSTQSAVYVDVPGTFTTTAATRISTMHWYSGYSDKVKGRDGCPGSCTNGKFPMVIQGIELAVGGYEVSGNAFMDIPGNALKRDVYVTNDASKITTNIATAKEIYEKSFTTVCTTASAWNYVTEMQIDVNNGAMLITKAGASGSGTATGYCDGMYIDSGTSGQREFLLLGSLRGGSLSGFSCLYASNSLTGAYWYFLARLSILA